MASASTVDSLLIRPAGPDPRPALALEGHAISHADLGEAVDRLSGRISAFAGPGDRVAVIASNVPALVFALFAIWRVGAVAVPLSARLREFELTRVLGDAEPAAIVTIDSYQGFSLSLLVEKLLPGLPAVRGCLVVDPLGEVLEEVTRDEHPGPAEPLDPDTAAILYTSGTTGAPKGALVSHACLLAGARELGALAELDPTDASILVVPIAHAFGLPCLLAAVASGGSAVLVDSTFSLGALLEAISAHGATVLHGSPALFADLLGRGLSERPTLRTGFVAGAVCPPRILEGLDAAGLTILNVFGMTEIGAATACRASDPPSLRSTTAGRPLPGYEFRVAPGERQEGLPGELQVRGPYVTAGYYRQPETTAEAFDGDWFRTGDLGSIDEAGYVSIAGRSKEVVHVAGFNVFPAEVEGFLLTHPDVAQAVVVGVPHERMGEVLEAYVVPAPGRDIEPATLLRFARSQIAGYKLPYAIRVLPELPLLPSGKPDRAALASSGNRSGSAP